jgi:uncharacterized protein involved in exopolysaccharide biosynthesis
MKRLEQVLRIIVALVIIAAMVTVSLFFWEARKLSAQTITTLQSTQKDINDTKQMLNATLYQVGDLAKEAHDTIQMEQKYLKIESQTLISTNQKLNETLDVAQNAIQTNSTELSVALKPIPDVLDQARTALVASATTITGLQQTEKQVNDLVTNLQPAAVHLSVTMDHVASISAQGDAEMKKLLAPERWYKKLGDDLITALKAVAVFY